MNNELITIRMATAADTEEILGIYGPYVTDTAITFEYEVPTVEEFAERIKHILMKYPYLVAILDKKIVGYAYASTFKDRAAYAWAVEMTVYVKVDCKAKGLGKKLYIALEEKLEKQNIINLNACIAYPNPVSIGFHQHMGYKTVGYFTKCGYKFETWYDMVWMEKMIGKHPVPPNEVIPITQLKK